MKSIALICPYFGKLPEEYFQLILNSCSYNKTIDWILITDDKTNYQYPKNVKVIYESWDKFRQYIKKRIFDIWGYECALNVPYKLCDVKPLYGKIFENYISSYDYWGNADLTDVIYGNLRKFLTNDVLTYDKINFLGHLTLYKNNDSVKNRCNLKFSNKLNMKEIIESNNFFGFDEIGIQKIYNKYGFSFIRKDNLVADISPLRYAFQLSKFDKDFNQYYEKFKRRIFMFKKGRVTSISLNNNENISIKEYGYVHFQKRKMKNLLPENRQDSFLIVPNKFIPAPDKVTRQIIKEHSKNRLYLPFFLLKYRALKARLVLR